jgi:uncharacterized protein
MKQFISGSFEWDTEKDEANAKKHGVSFEQAAALFDRHYLRLRTAHESEVRWIALGELERRIVAVIYTERAGRIRIISARMARKYEREIYKDRIGDRA